jgi:phage terminase large subunit
MLQSTTALRKIAALKKKYRIVRGSQGSAKTISILILLINHASSCANKDILIVSEELTKMRLTVIKDFINVMRIIGIYNEERFLAGTLYKFPNGSFIKFIGLDKEDVGKGLRGDVAYFNEANKIKQEAFRQIASRRKIVYADYNPDAEFFIDTDIIGSEDCDFLQLDFRDNELLDESERREILKYKERGYNEDGTVKDNYWANIWQVYGLGNIGNFVGAIFNNWEIVEEVPKEAKLLAYGLDWGFSNDPTALVAVYKYNQDILIDELIYQTGLTNSKLVALMNELGVSKTIDIIADSSDPKSIQDLEDMGFGNIYGAKKGQDSVNFGINKLQEFKILITQRSKNAKKEFQNYRWDVDRNGKSIGKPVDDFNHIIDPLRYVAMDKLTSQEPDELYF